MRRAFGLLWGVIIAAVVVAGVAGCGKGPAKILEMKMCTEVDDSGQCVTEPTYTFGPEDDIFVSVKFENFIEGSSLVARWYRGYDLIKEQSYKATGAEDGFHAFVIPADKPYEPGSYRADISLDANPQPTIEFKIEEQ